MGDRVLMQVHNGKEIGPVVYGHWCGARAPEIVRKLRARMVGRMNDVNYWSARLVQEAVADDEGSTSYGCWSAKKLLTAEDSHGDAGVILIDARDGSVRCLGGYFADADFAPGVDATR